MTDLEFDKRTCGKCGHWLKAEDRRYGQCLDCGRELLNEQKDPSIRKTMRYFIRTNDGRIAIRTLSKNGYTLCVNVAERRKEWTKQSYAQKALDKICVLCSFGSKCLVIDERELS